MPNTNAVQMIRFHMFIEQLLKLFLISRLSLETLRMYNEKCLYKIVQTEATTVLKHMMIITWKIYDQFYYLNSQYYLAMRKC